MKPLQSPRFRFTIAQLIHGIAIVALFFAALRSPPWLIGLAIGIILEGFAFDRARGGAGIHGAMIAGALGSSSLAFTTFVLITGSWINLVVSPVVIVIGALAGWAAGVVMGYWVFAILNVFGRAAGPSGSNLPGTPIEDSGIWFLPTDKRPASRGVSE